MNNANIDADALYDKQMHKMGLISMIIILTIMLSIPFFISKLFGVPIKFSPAFWAAFIPIVIVNLPGCIVEVITYSPLLGTGGTYLAFITGNLSNLKIPCAMNARELTGTVIGSKEGEIVSTISIASSAIVTTVTLFLGVILISPLTPILENPVLLPAFKTVVPAVFGALGYKYAKQYPKVSVLPLSLSIIIFLLFPSLTTSVSIIVLIMAVVAIVYAFLLWKKGWVK